jgi:hypothetical protein
MGYPSMSVGLHPTVKTGVDVKKFSRSEIRYLTDRPTLKNRGPTFLLLQFPRVPGEVENIAAASEALTIFFEICFCMVSTSSCDLR